MKIEVDGSLPVVILDIEILISDLIVGFKL